MMLPRNDIRDVQDAIDMRLRLAQVSGSPRPINKPVSVPAAAPAPKLFLVKSATRPHLPLKPLSSRTRHAPSKFNQAGLVLVVPSRRAPYPPEQTLAPRSPFQAMSSYGRALLLWMKPFMQAQN